MIGLFNLKKRIKELIFELFVIQKFYLRSKERRYKFWYKYKFVRTVEVRNFLVDVQSGKLARQKCEISVSGIPTFLILEGNYIPSAQTELFYRNYHVCVSEGFQVSNKREEIFCRS